MAANLPRGGDDGGVSVTDLKSIFDVEGPEDERHRSFDHRVGGHIVHHACDLFEAEPQFPLAHRYIRELLEDLHRDSEIGFSNKALRGSFARLIRHINRSFEK